MVQISENPLVDPFSPRPRPGWVREQIQKFNRKLEPKFQAVKFSKMRQSSLAFYSGSNHLFWADLGESDLLGTFGGGKDTRLWVSGDAHCDNFGSFADATGRLVYDLNDFDEAVVADYQLDLLRLGVSLVLAGRESKGPDSSLRRLVKACAVGYWRELKRCRWYPNIRHAPWDEEQASGSIRKFLSQARKHFGFPHMLERWTKVGKDGLGFKTQGNPDLESIPKEITRKLEKALNQYAKSLQPWPADKPRLFEIVDLARRLNAGIGSEGLKRYYALVRVGEVGDGAYRILNIKQQVEPSPWNYLPKKARRKTTELCGGNQALRVDSACRALGRYPDPWLGRIEFQGDQYLVNERSPFKGVLPLNLLDDDAAYQMGAILARAHCRSKKSFAKKVFRLIKEDKKAFQKQIVSLSHAYADQVEMDFLGFSGKN